MIHDGETDIEITMKSPRVDIVESTFIGDFWVFIN